MEVINGSVINSTMLTGNLLLDNISFNNYGLQNTRIITEGEGFGLRDYPGRRINLVDIPQGDGQILNDTFFSGRTITVQGYLKATNRSELDTLIDEFKLKLSFPNKLLKWRVNGELRQIKATCENITFGTKENIYITFDLSFVSQDSFWEKLTQESYLIENMSDAVRTEDITVNYKEVYPLFIIGVKSGSITNMQVKANGIGLTVAQTINSGDVIYINGENKDVLINGVDTDYTGVMPYFQNGSNNLVFTLTGTYSADVSIIYKNKLM